MAVKIIASRIRLPYWARRPAPLRCRPGNERAPAALRAAGLSDRLRAAGFEVTDHGDDPVQLSQPDEESPRARNLARVVKSLEALRPRVEIAVKSGALPIILTGDCTIALATVAGVRRYFRQRQHDLHGSRRGSECSGDDAFRLRGRHGRRTSHRPRRRGTRSILDRAASGSRSRYRPLRRGSPRSSRRRIPAPRADSRLFRRGHSPPRRSRRGSHRARSRPRQAQ